MLGHRVNSCLAVDNTCYYGKFEVIGKPVIGPKLEVALCTDEKPDGTVGDCVGISITPSEGGLEFKSHVAYNEYVLEPELYFPK